MEYATWLFGIRQKICFRKIEVKETDMVFILCILIIIEYKIMYY